MATQTEEVREENPEEEEISLLASVAWILACLIAVFIFLALANVLGHWLAGVLGVSGGATVARVVSG